MFLKQRQNNRLMFLPGLSLVEVLVSMFIFTVIMASLASFFGASANSHRLAREQQKSLEAAQEAMNLMAKSIRTSKIIDESASRITIYNYSTGNCERFEIDGNDLKYLLGGTDSSCAAPFSTSSDLISGSVQSGLFSAIKSSGTSPYGIGRVTIALKVGTVTNNTNLQTTVSLRDYQTANFDD